MGKKVLKILLGSLAALVTIAVFYIAVVLGQPQEDPEAIHVSMDQPLLAAAPAQSLAGAGELPGMLSAFPVPMLYAVDGSGLTLTGGMTYDASFEDGFARIGILTYQTTLNEKTIDMTVQTIYPARALAFVPRGDYRIAKVAGQPLAGMASVRMEDGKHIRLHVQGAEGIYVLTVPLMTADELAALTRSLQLYAPEEGA